MDIKEKVRKLVEKEVGFKDDYFLSSIDNVIDNILSLDKNPKHRILYQLQYEKDVSVDTMNDLIKHIQKDLIEDKNKHNYLWHDDNPKDEFEKGVMNVIRLIQHRIHCIMD